jgi:hypothetical protein
MQYIVLLFLLLVVVSQAAIVCSHELTHRNAAGIYAVFVGFWCMFVHPHVAKCTYGDYSFLGDACSLFLGGCIDGCCYETAIVLSNTVLMITNHM